MSGRFHRAVLPFGVALWCAAASAQVSFRAGDHGVESTQDADARAAIGHAQDQVLNAADSTAKAETVQSAESQTAMRNAQDEYAMRVLRWKYSQALQLKIESQWTGKPPPPGQTCRVLVHQMPGGEVLTAEPVEPCGFDDMGRTSLRQAVAAASPLPFSGFEAVFQRQAILIFKAPAAIKITAAHPIKPVSTATTADYINTLQKHLMSAWQKPKGQPPGQLCAVQYDQVRGGIITETRIAPDCFVGSDGKQTAASKEWQQSIDRAAKAASPLPYLGFEALWKRTFKITYHNQ